MISLEEIGTRARGAEPVLRIMGTETKNRVLKKAAENLVADADAIIAANALDMEHGREKGMSKGLLDRLFLDQSRIEAMAEGLCQVSELDDPIGEVLGMKKRPNGLLIGQKRVPLGVVGIIYEARPNVTADAFALCFKTGNVVILKGGSDAIHSNMAIVASLRKTLKEEQVPEDALLLSVHQNFFTEGKYHGAQVFYAKTPGSQTLAEQLQANLALGLEPGNRRQCKKSDGVYLMERIGCTGVLVECGF